MEFFKWDDKYLIGINQIDEQHKIIFKILNEAYDAFLKNEHQDKLDEIIDNLINYSHFHFKTEEEYFKKFPDESVKNHILQHELFKQKINSFKEQYTKDKKGVFYVIIKFIKDWFLNHINIVDKIYFNNIKL